MENEPRQTHGPHRVWDGKSVHVTRDPSPHDVRDIEISLTEGAARDLDRMIRRLTQTTALVSPWVSEIAEALSFVMTGDAQSATIQRRRVSGLPPDTDGPVLESTRVGETWDATTDPRLKALRKREVEPGIPLGTRTIENEEII